MELLETLSLCNNQFLFNSRCCYFQWNSKLPFPTSAKSRGRMEFLLFNILLLDYRSWNSWNKWKSIWHFHWIEAEVAFFTAISLFLSIVCNSTKKPAKWKKHSVSIFFPFPPLGKILLVWFEFFPSYLSRKKGTSETFLGFGVASASKNFSSVPFFLLR